MKISSLHLIIMFCCQFWGISIFAQTAPSWCAAQNFAVLAYSTVTSTGNTVVKGSVGVSPGSAVTGFPPAIMTNGGTINSGVGSPAGTAQVSAQAAYNHLIAQVSSAPLLTPTDVLGQSAGLTTLTPGIYSYSSSAQLTGNLVLNDGGDSNAVFIFKMASTLTTASYSTVSMSSGGKGRNVFWQIGSSATIGTYTTFIGNIIATASITMTTGSSTTGRLVALNGAVTLDNNNVSPDFTIVLPAITGNTSGAFCKDSTIQLAHSIEGGVWAVDNTGIATIGASSGLLTAVAVGTSIVSYTLSGSTCGTTFNTQIIRDCGTGSGIDGGGSGGLESKSLGDAVAKRLYNNAIASMQGPIDYTQLKLVGSDARINRISGVGANLTLAELLPQKMVSKTYVASVSTPLDIPAFTNAVDVMSIDFSVNNKAKAVAFATKTLGAVYDHTKSICDRLKGSELVGLQNVMVNDINIIRYDLKSEAGVIEYAMSFIVGAKAGRTNYTIQSNWLNKDYQTDEVMYNIQLWAINTGLLMDMANDVISKLKATLPVTEIKSITGLPKTYVTLGKRVGTNLTGAINNTLTNTNGYFEVLEKANEKSILFTKRTVPFTINAKGLTILNLPVSDNYENMISVFLNGQLQDEIFMSDGSWGYDYNRSTTIVKSFVISNDSSIATKTTNDYLLFRNMKITATSPDAVTVFKLLRGGGVLQDLSQFKILKFIGSGAGTNLRITLVKNGLVNWNDQFSYVLPLSKNEVAYEVDLSNFVSKTNKDKFSATDITNVVFSFEVSSGKSTDLIASIAQVSFSKETAGYASSLTATDLRVFPNPSTGRFTANFKSTLNNTMNLQVTESGTGKLILSRKINAVVGNNTVIVDMKGDTGLSIYILTLEGNGIRYLPVKLVVRK